MDTTAPSVRADRIVDVRERGVDRRVAEYR